ncbi:MAG: glycoside hydrolase family 99-like domain-containing protein [Opitutaceae bacterium]|jgi:hypothetical protein|nr:glycoside hydrolase family 99-like domain-containing protein [Opitutaceae bacterium]
MNRTLRLLRTIPALAVAAAFLRADGVKPAVPRYDVAAYVWPSCHDDPRGRALLWPEGTGEWEVIKKGTPRFPGHYQPRQPLWGHEPDDDPRVVERWIDIAAAHGVNVFVYDWYWYDGGPFLEDALNNGFLGARNNLRMSFYIMWANHDVKRNYWNVHLHKDDESLLWRGMVDMDNFRQIVARVITQYFARPNYYKVDGRPLFSIFSMEKLLEGFGGDEDAARRALDYFRDEVKKAGFPGLHLQMNQGGGGGWTAKRAATARKLGIDSAASYNMGGFDEDYLVHGAKAVSLRERSAAALGDIPLFPCVSIAWDDTPRFPKKGMRDVTHYHDTPESFAMLLLKARDYADRHPGRPRLININAWNEWVEGSYLLPDMRHGFGYLEAVKAVFVDGKHDRFMKAPDDHPSG